MKILSIKIPIFTTEFEETVRFYETLSGEKTMNRFAIESPGITVARIGDLLIIGGTKEALQSLPEIKATFTVDSIDEYRDSLISQGAAILQPPTATPTGKNMIAKNPDGLIFEYVELKSH